VTLREIVGVREITREFADANLRAAEAANTLPAAPSAKRTCLIGPTSARPRKVGVIEIDAAGIWRAVERGALPPPLRGAWTGPAWPIDAVRALARPATP
jgi:hypothetical protein